MWKRAFSASFGVYASSYKWMSLFVVGAFLIGMIGEVVFSSLASEIIPLGSILGVVVLLICAIMSTLSLFGFGTSFLVQLGASRRVAISVLYVRALMEWVAVVLGFVVMSGIETLALRLFLPQIETVWLALFVPIWVYPLVVGAMVIFFGFFGALMLRYGRGAYAVLYAVIVLPGLRGRDFNIGLLMRSRAQIGPQKRHPCRFGMLYHGGPAYAPNLQRRERVALSAARREG